MTVLNNNDNHAELLSPTLSAQALKSSVPPASRFLWWPGVSYLKGFRPTYNYPNHQKHLFIVGTV